MLTYAQNFEDVMLERLFKEVDRGFYVDVGAWDPVSHSVTRHFYDRGWSGVNVEPIAGRCRLFNAERPRDVNLNKAIGPEPGSMTFFECEEESYLSTLSPEVAAGMRERGLTVHEYSVEVITLADIFEKHCPGTVDFLKIDVEGFEGELLKSFDLRRYRPRALVIESTIPATTPTTLSRLDEIGTWSGWEPAVLSMGYQFAYFDGLNRFYVRDEDEGLIGRLGIPPGVFDVIEYPLVQELQADRAERLRMIEELSDTLRTVEADRAARLGVIEELSQALRAAEADRAARLETIEALSDTLRTVEADRAARLEAIEALSDTLRAVEADRAARLEVIDMLSGKVAALEEEKERRFRLLKKVAGLVIQKKK